MGVTGVQTCALPIFGRRDLDLPRPWQPVVVERRVVKIVGVVAHDAGKSRRSPENNKARTTAGLVSDLVRSRRLELPRDRSHKHLKLARLPVPPRPHSGWL